MTKYIFLNRITILTASPSYRTCAQAQEQKINHKNQVNRIFFKVFVGSCHFFSFKDIFDHEKNTMSASLSDYHYYYACQFVPIVIYSFLKNEQVGRKL